MFVLQAQLQAFRAVSCVDQCNPRRLFARFSAKIHPKPQFFKPNRSLITNAGKEGSFYESEVVQQEMTSIMKDFETLSGMMSRYANFDLDGKRIFLNQMDAVLERLRIFYARLTFTDDPLAKDSLKQFSTQLLFANTNPTAVYDGMAEQIKDLRKLLEEEEKIADPQQLSEFRKQLQTVLPSPMQNTLHKNLSMENLMKDPSAMAAISMHPRGLQAVSDVLTQGPSAIEKYNDDYGLYTALKKIFELE